MTPGTSRKRALALAGAIAVAAAILGTVSYVVVTARRKPADTVPAVVASPDVASKAAPASPAQAKKVACPIELHDISRETGITFRHTDGSSGKHYIAETVTSGLATFDICSTM